MSETRKLFESFQQYLNEADERLEYVKKLKDSNLYNKYDINRLVSLYKANAPLDILQLIEPFTKDSGSSGYGFTNYILKIYTKKPYLLDLVKYLVNYMINNGFNDNNNDAYWYILNFFAKESAIKEEDVNFLKELFNKFSLETCKNVIIYYTWDKRDEIGSSSINKNDLQNIQQSILNNIDDTKNEDKISKIVEKCFKTFEIKYRKEDKISNKIIDSMYNNISNFLIELAKEDSRIEIEVDDRSTEFYVSGSNWNWEEEKYQELADGTPKIWSTWYVKFKKFVNNEFTKYNIKPEKEESSYYDAAKTRFFSKKIKDFKVDATLDYVMGNLMILSVEK